MEVLVCAGCTTQIQTRHSSTGSERKLLNSMTHHSSQWQVISKKKGEAPRIIRPKTNYTVQSTKWLTGLGKMQEKYSQGTERLQHCVSRLPLRSLEAAEYDTLKLQWIYKTEISKSGSRRKCCSHRSWRDLNERQDTEYRPTPRSTWCIHDITSFTFKINSD